MRLTVLGAGSWGTALAMQLARAGNPVTLWGRKPSAISLMARDRENERYLPGVAFPSELELESRLDRALANAEIALVVTPSHAFADTLIAAKGHLKKDALVGWASKGFEPGSGRLLHEVAEDLLGPQQPGAVVTGPSFAKEVAADLPTAVVVASPDQAFAKQLAGALHAGNFRAYTSTDIIGAELGGAVKNVLAVGTGIADGMALGTNARAGLITRGLAEMARLATAMGARAETLMGLSGVGDLVLTCTGDLSRNRRFGLALGRGETIEQALATIGQVVEGVKTAEEVCRLGRRYQVDMPISEQVLAVVQGQTTPHQAVRNLMQREPKAEN